VAMVLVMRDLCAAAVMRHQLSRSSVTGRCQPGLRGLGICRSASEHLERRGQTADAYLHACIRWLARDPDAALAATADDWPAPRPAGCPPSRESHCPARPASSGPPPADGS